MKHLASFLLLIFIATESFAAAQLQKIHNVVKNVSGNAFVKNQNKNIIAIKNGAILQPGDIIYTGPGSSFEVHFEDESVMTVTSLTVMKVDELLANQNPGQSEPSYQSKFKLRVGEVRASVSRKTGVLKKFEVQTPVGTASVRGTEKIVNYSPDAGMKVNTLHGQVLVMANNGIEKYVNQGEFTKALGMQTQLPQAELQIEQAKPFITNESEQYILENRGLEVTQEANQILVSQITKAQNQGPEAIVDAHQGTQQGASKTPAQNDRPTGPSKREFTEAEALRMAEAVFEQRYQEQRTELTSQLPAVPTATLKQRALDLLNAQNGGLQRGRNMFDVILDATRSNPDGVIGALVQDPSLQIALRMDATNELSHFYDGLVAANYADALATNSISDKADAAIDWVAEMIRQEDPETEIRARLDALEDEVAQNKSQIIEELKEKVREAHQSNFDKEFEEQMQGKGQASQQVQQLININKLVAGL